MDIREVVEKAVKMEQVKKENEIYITEISRCLRYSWYFRRKPIEPSHYALLGSDVHSRLLPIIAEVLTQEGWECDYEVETPVLSIENRLIRGRADVVCISPKRVVIELKTTSNPSVFNKAILFYRRQLWYYMALFKAVLGYLVLIDFQGKIIYSEYHTMSEREFRVFIKEILDRASALISTTPPSREATSFCNICQFRNQCFNKTLI